MRKNKVMVCMMSAVLLVASQAYAASSLGGLTIRETPPAEKESQESVYAREAVSSVHMPADDIVGGLSVSKALRSRKDMRTASETAETARIKSLLAQAINVANEKKYSQAVSIVRSLSHEHPEIPSLIKWAGVYSSMAGNYDDSQSFFEVMRMAYPISDISKDLMTEYYEIENARGQGVSRAELKKMISALDVKVRQLDPLYNVAGIPVRNIYSVLVEYQRLQGFLKDGEIVSPQGKAQMDKVWSMIPREKHLHLDDFYGFNIDRLSYTYGIFYNRKDILEAYVAHEGNSENKDCRRFAGKAETVLLSWH